MAGGHIGITETEKKFHPSRTRVGGKGRKQRLVMKLRRSAGLM